MTLATGEAPSRVGREHGPGGASDDPTFEDPIGPATRSLLAALAEARNPLAAEVVLCHALGAVRVGLPEDVDEQERRRVLEEMLAHVVDHAEALGSEEALALLRVCSVLGPASTRNAAGEAARGLAAAGVPDRPWAASLGIPELLRAWVYGDSFGAQSSVGLQFDYRGREHVIMVLIDHLLGGGVKDCWLSEGRAAKSLRARTAAAMGNNPNTYFEDIKPPEVLALLGEALACPPCPEQPDQVEDVDAYLYLLQARVEHLARLS